ncbi:hypothetical protein SR18_gp038c [Caulobacter phage SR18]|nr:hypothetical protein SR18_gp038c [Caulobacter phage SR18]
MSDNPLQDPVLTGLAGVLGTGFLAWLGQRLVGKAAIQTAVNQGFKELMEQMRQELKVALRERDDARAECDTHQATIEELRRTIAALRAARPANA